MKITLSNNSSFRVSIKPKETINVNTIFGGVQVPATFGDLEDFDETNLADNSVIMYNSTTKKYTTVNVDEIFTKAVTDTVSPGISTVFIDALDVDLDDRIDLDAGSF